MSDRRQKTYTVDEKVAAAYRVLVNGHSKKSVAAELSMSRVTLRKWCQHPDIIRRVELKRAASPKAQPPEQLPRFSAGEGEPLIDDVRKRKLLEGLKTGMPMRYALQRCRLNPEILAGWYQIAAKDAEVRELLADLEQAAGDMVFDMLQVVLAGGGSGRGAQWVLAKFDRDAFGERPETDDGDRGLDGYTDADLQAIAGEA